MQQSTTQKRGGNLAVGIIALALFPILILLDTFWATARGWKPEAPSLVTAALAAAFGALALLVIATLIAPLRRAIQRRSANLVLLVSGCLIGWLAGEAILRAALPWAPFHRRAPGTQLVYDPDPFTFFEVSGEAHATYNRLGIRGTEPPPRGEAYRILCLGGSTTESLYLDDEETWPHLLMQDLNAAGDGRYWVGNAGHGDLATGHHLRFIRSSALAGDVDCLLVLAGANDLMRFLLRFDAGEQPPPLWHRSAVLAYLRDYWNVVQGQGIVWDTTGEELLQRLRRGFDIAPWNVLDDWDQGIDEYESRIRRIIAAAHERGVRIVFASQPVLWDDYLSQDAEKRLTIARADPYPRDWDYLNAANLRDVIQRYNETLAAVCQETGTGFIDLAAQLSGQEGLFYDDYHLNERGAAQAAQIIAEWFLEHKQPSQEAAADRLRRRTVHIRDAVARSELPL